MKLDEKYVITINRELGSGGRTIGKKLAERLGVPFYDKVLIQGLQEKYKLTTEASQRLHLIVLSIIQWHPLLLFP